LAEEKLTIKKQLQQRAVFWYNQAIPQLAGLIKAKVEKRVQLVEGPLGKAIDLLKLVDIMKDTIKGKWTFQGKAILIPSADYARLQIPYLPPEEYKLCIEATRKGGGNALVIGLHVGDRQCLAVFDSRYGSSFRSGLELIDGKAVDTNETGYGRQVINDGEVCEIICYVRRNGVTITANGKPVCIYNGDTSRLSLNPNWAIPQKQVLFLGAWKSTFHITKLELTPITGSGMLLER
jgi:hypothetical protein